MCMVLLVIKWWITLPMGLNPLLVVRYLKTTHKYLKRLKYSLSEFCSLQTWLVDQAHIANGVIFYIMFQ